MPNNIVPYLSRIAATAGPSSVQHYILNHGHAFESAELTRAELDFTNHIQWESRLPKQCFHNCQVEAMILPEMPGINLYYVEGYFADALGFPIHHAWLSLNDKVVDPTLRVSPEDGRVIGNIPQDWEYYGVTLPTNSVEHSLKHGHIVSLIDDWECHWPLINGDSVPHRRKPTPAKQRRSAR